MSASILAIVVLLVKIRLTKGDNSGNVKINLKKEKKVNHSI